MENYFIEGTEDTPQINFNAETHTFTVSGRSLPENAIDFYAPVLEWIDTTLNENDSMDFIFEVKIEYFNTHRRSSWPNFSLPLKNMSINIMLPFIGSTKKRIWICLCQEINTRNS